MVNYPVIPETIVIHLGPPDSPAQNVTASFPDYIKNVASSEIYPTWPEEALRANILAQISVALNRVYTEFYRSRGYDFDITNSIANDQSYVYQRDIFENVGRIVDEIFDSYIRRVGFIEPLYAQFCDGVEVTCTGLSQWGSVELANQGQNYLQILRSYYGDDTEIVSDVPVDNISESVPPIDIGEGDTGNEVQRIQIQLNRISSNFPGIPKIYPTDGFFDESTTAAVRKFQEVFGLTPDGIVGRATWYRIQYIYNAVKKLFEINSEGLRLSETPTAFPGTLSLGTQSPGVITVQYYLSYIALFVGTVLAPAVDGAFGEGTRDAVISFQKTYMLEPTGEVDLLTWNRIENTYNGILARTPYVYREGLILPFPGRVLREGLNGDDVRALQEYLNFIGRTYTSIPRVNADGDFGPATARAVAAFKSEFGLPGDPERVSAQVWNAIINVYDDLYVGTIVNEGQFPGYGVS